MDTSSSVQESPTPAPSAPPDEVDPQSNTVEQLVRGLGASDLFVFRRMTDSQFVHVGGAGEGKDAADAVAMDVRTDPLASQVRPGQPLWSRHDEPHHIFGPYYAAAAAAVRLNQDVLMVFGASAGESQGFEPTAAELMEAAGKAAELVGGAGSPSASAKEELDVLHAMQTLAAGRGRRHGVAESLDDIARVATELLGCEFAITWQPDDRFSVHEAGWTLPGARDQLGPIMQKLWESRGDLPSCIQDAKQSPLDYPLDPVSGVRSYYVLPIGEPAVALVLLAHTDTARQGFTQESRTRAEQLAVIADSALATAGLREHILQAAAEESAAHAALASLQPELAEAALHDPLTGLPNRVLLQRHADSLSDRQLPESSATVGEGAPTSVLLYIDLDRFKSINDDYGHAVGDGVLVEFARRLRESCRPNDIAARLAGDEFVLLLVDPLTDAEALTVANRVVRAAAVPYLIEKTVVTIGASVGVAAFAAVRDGEDPTPSLDALLHRADLAMYRAKNRGRGRAEVFTERTTAPRVTQDRRWNDDPAMGRRLRAALDEGTLTLRYQPVVDLVTGQILEVEALVSWPARSEFVMSSAQLGALAERTGLIEPLTEWAIREACRQAAVWDSMLPTGATAPVVAINASPTQLSNPAFLRLVTTTVTEAGLPPSRLCIELAEPETRADRESLVAALPALRESGVRLALDGFGSGLSSLTAMRDLPLDWVKLDARLAGHVDIEAADAALVRLIIESAHSLGLRVCALDVDRHAQLEQLMTMGCDAVQGHLLGGPVDAALLDTRTRLVRNLTVPVVGGLAPERGTLTARIDRSGMFTYLSAESVGLLGYQPSELVGTRALDLVPLEYQDRASAPVREPDGADQNHVVAHPLLRKDGTLVWVEPTHRFLRDTVSRELLHLTTTVSDVTGRVHAAHDLADRQRRLQSAFDSAPQGSAVLTAEGTLLQVNAALLEMLGRTEADVLGHTLHEFVSTDDAPDPLSALVGSNGDRADESTDRTRLVQGDGSLLPADVTVRLIRDDDDDPSYIVAHILALSPSTT